MTANRIYTDYEKQEVNRIYEEYKNLKKGNDRKGGYDAYIGKHIINRQFLPKAIHDLVKETDDMMENLKLKIDSQQAISQEEKRTVSRRFSSKNDTIPKIRDRRIVQESGLNNDSYQITNLLNEFDSKYRMLFDFPDRLLSVIKRV